MALVLRNDVAQVEIMVEVGLLGVVPVPVKWHGRHDELACLITDRDGDLIPSPAEGIAGTTAGPPSGYLPSSLRDGLRPGWQRAAPHESGADTKLPGSGAVC